MTRDDRWRAEARRRQSHPEEQPSRRWWQPDTGSRRVLRELVLPVVGGFALLVAANIAHSDFLGYLAFGLPMTYWCALWYFAERRRSDVLSGSQSGSESLTDDEIRSRVSEEREAELPIHSHAPAPVLTSMWRQFGRTLTSREQQIRDIARKENWTFTPLDPPASRMLDAARVTVYTPTTSRNSCRGEQRKVPFVLTDLVRPTFNAGDFDKEQSVALVTATMCAMPFAAPHALHIIHQAHILADIRADHEVVKTESASFNERYRVSGPQSSWIKLILNPYVLDLMVQHSISSLVVDGGKFAIAASPWLPATGLTGFVELCDALRYSALSAAAPQEEVPIDYFS